MRLGAPIRMPFWLLEIVDAGDRRAERRHAGERDAGEWESERWCR